MKQVNLVSREFTGPLVLPQSWNRVYFYLQVLTGTIYLEIGKGKGRIQLRQHEKFDPLVVPTSEIRITGTGTYVILTNGTDQIGFANGDTAMAGYIREVDFIHTTNQLQTALSTPLTVLYGPALTSPNNYISIDAQGIITILKSDYYLFKTRHRIGRTGSSGVSKVFQWVEVSLDDGVTWIVTGNPVMTGVESATGDKTFTDTAAIALPAGAKIRARWARSATGDNSGNLVAEAPDAILQGVGVNVAPSAQLTVYISDPNAS